ncbi:Peptidoglycan/xylan/chitin deacetylase, PgdA/CDA1 family [Flavobacterium swingsii]|uniref:Peptidoglycan/xylan/chitin deacetylase, PgdA/CDA1 family n=1 Tax=Flavobacterium swingsii TaxID=498292 RepID=A0A1I0XNV7_9FLAO|nr:polysaccharide deacetylase family protein [Flavobacterium swingsii]SFB02829.1 Peptidoglycan/xylan/chitin deacetylase, PgdA/CDA1 family [Flavobacterium swingsii]
MNFYWIKTPQIIKRLFSNQVWDIPNTENKIYLTFDDGPTPEITEWVLEILKENSINATFFCIGNNIEKHPEIFNKIINDGHGVGNHTFNHKNGWKTTTADYLQNVELCESAIKNQLPKAFGTKIRNLFRPPYGKIKPSQSKKLRNLGYKIIMWDILTADFDEKTSKEKCLENATKKVTSGSVIVFHDSVKAFKNLEYALPKTIQILKEKGFVFDVIQ